jgi:hypothetical protein
MKNRVILILAILIVLALACETSSNLATQTPAPSATPTPPGDLLHFENDFLSFDYLPGTGIFSAGDPAFLTYPHDIQLGGELVVGLADPKWIKSDDLYSSIGIFRHSIPPGSTLDDIVKTAYGEVPYPIEELEGSGPFPYDGVVGYQKIYRVASGPLWYTLRDIWFEQEGGILFRVSLWEEVYAVGFQPLADIFYKSLVIKDTLPPLEVKLTPLPFTTQTPFPAGMLRHYEDEVFAFDYAKGLDIYAGGDPGFASAPGIQLGEKLLVALGDDRFFKFEAFYRSIRIFSQPMLPGSNLEAIMLAAYDQMELNYPHSPGVLDASGPLTVDGLPAYQWTYRVFSGEPAYDMRDVWIVKESEVFVISIWSKYTDHDDFMAFQAGADALLNSLHFK